MFESNDYNRADSLKNQLYCKNVKNLPLLYIFYIYMLYGGIIYSHTTAENPDSNIYHIFIIHLIKKSWHWKSTSKVIQNGQVCICECKHVWGNMIIYVNSHSF